MTRRDRFLEGLRAKQEAARVAANPTAAKPISEMSEAELDREMERLNRELRRSKEQAVEVGAPGGSGPGLRAHHLPEETPAAVEKTQGQH